MDPLDLSYRYAKALFLLAIKHHINIEDPLSLFQILQPKKQFFTSYSIPLEKKKDVLQTVFKDKIPPVLLHFLFIVLDHALWDKLPEIAFHYRLFSEKIKEKKTVQLVTAKPFDENIKEAICKKLEGIYKKQIDLQEKIKPQMGLGFLLFVGNDMIDARLDTKLKNLKKDLILC